MNSMNLYFTALLLVGAASIIAFAYRGKSRLTPQFRDVIGTTLAAAFLFTLWWTFALPMQGVVVIPWVFTRMFTTMLILFLLIVFLLIFPRLPDDTAQRIHALELRAAEQPNQVRFAWELAHVKLEAYIDRNLQQVKLVFFAAVGTMVAGFGMVGYGVILAWSRPETIKPSLVSAGSGILTEFIAATFMVVYRSTMAQATNYMNVLERINTVGMAVQILDSIPETNTELKNATRARMIELLLGHVPNGGAGMKQIGD